MKYTKDLIDRVNKLKNAVNEFADKVNVQEDARTECGILYRTITENWKKIDSIIFYEEPSELERQIDAAIEQYHQNKATGQHFSEFEINNLGYQLAGMNKIKEAIKIFKLNVDAYPEAFNVYDSLGEAYMRNGDDSLAIKNYQKSLELNPRNTNAELMIKRIRKEK